ncbi:MAG: phage tail assembly protein [Paracoccus sp. (in: a-proteobacteria)]|uniref:phage tail assembly protein n=1 Tax=Paracoccus sp. TaxID=267 RepID=UPI0026DEFF0F|nr:phage tail assembly protein [Paracoccus sp. (in: a-proteobacteria)]MDO5631146.1 phage tail assembly protein [Paracoccus sp. (in: a-proteobacteria)]
MAKHIKAAARTATLELDWPLELDDGSVLDQITLRRLTGAEVADLQEQMVPCGISEAALLAAFCDQSADIIASLDADDFIELKERVVDFLPKRLRAMVEAEMARLTAAATS